MKTLLITPLYIEFSPLLQAFHGMGYTSTAQDVGNLTVYEIDELKLYLAQGGHGKPQFGIQTQHILDLIPNISLVICAGAAGGIAPFVGVGDLVIATATIEHDYRNRFSQKPLPSFDGSAKHLQHLQTLGILSDEFKIHFGNIASGDEDIVELTRARELHTITDALAVAWEGAGGAKASKFMEVPYIEIRGLTDLANDNAPSDFHENLKLIMPRIATLVAKLQTSA